MWKQFLKDYFIFTRKERRGVIIIVCLIIIVSFAPLFYSYFFNKEEYDYAEFKSEIALLKNDTTGRYLSSNRYNDDYYNDYSIKRKKYTPVNATLFYFDPNTASVSDWLKLGVRPKTVATIQNYIEKGGKFYDPEDIKKIWGLSKKNALRLIPYVQIKNPKKSFAVYKKRGYPKREYDYPERVIEKVNINLADTTSFKNLPGIGSKLSARIIDFRNKLGGFYSIGQVGETFLLPDSTFQKIKPYLVMGDSSVKKINVNTATIDEMKAHPYIRYNVANALFQYRQQHGNYQQIKEIKKIMIITDEMYRKALPYLTIK